MKKYALGFSLMVSHPSKLPYRAQIPIFARAGFDSFFISTGFPVPLAELPELTACADANGIRTEAFHATSDAQNAMWAEGTAGETRVLQVQTEIEACAKAKIGKLVLHVAHGPGVPVSQIGLERFARLDDFAEAHGVCICYENSGSIPLLRAVLVQTKPCHGWCYDSGHHFCWAPNEPLLNEFGAKLRYTHLHDNLGVPAGKTRGDDLHFLPFDGKIDWHSVAHGLCKCGYSGTLNAELSCNRESYGKMPYEAFVAEAKTRLERLEQMISEE